MSEELKFDIGDIVYAKNGAYYGLIVDKDNHLVINTGDNMDYVELKDSPKTQAAYTKDLEDYLQLSLVVAMSKDIDVDGYVDAYSFSQLLQLNTNPQNPHVLARFNDKSYVIVDIKRISYDKFKMQILDMTELPAYRSEARKKIIIVKLTAIDYPPHQFIIVTNVYKVVDMIMHVYPWLYQSKYFANDAEQSAFAYNIDKVKSALQPLEF